MSGLSWAQTLANWRQQKMALLEPGRCEIDDAEFDAEIAAMYAALDLLVAGIKERGDIDFARQSLGETTA